MEGRGQAGSLGRFGERHQQKVPGDLEKRLVVWLLGLALAGGLKNECSFSHGIFLVYYGQECQQSYSHCSKELLLSICPASPNEAPHGGLGGREGVMMVCPGTLEKPRAIHQGSESRL